MNAIGMAVVGLLIVTAVLGSFAWESLRSFSRSRLDQVCWRIGHRERLAVVLRCATDGALSAALVTIVSVLALAALGGIRVAADLSDADTAAGRLAALVEIVFLIAGFVVAFFLLPWGLARVVGERFLGRCWPLVELLVRVCRPYLGLARRLDSFLHRLFGLKEAGEGRAETLAREIKSVVDLGQREGLLAPQAGRMIERVIELGEADVAAIMTPRTDMDCLRGDISLDEARRQMVEAGHSRMPVIGTSTDDIVGILYAKDLLRHTSATGDGEQLHLKDVVREPFYVPETTGIDKLLENMKRRHVQIAIVIDEYSGVAGLVTMEDILEQIVGEIVDEYDTAEDTGIRQTAPGSVEVAAWVRIDDLDEQFGFGLPEDEDYDTIGGFVYSQLGRIPRKRDTFTWNDLRVTVLDADKRRIHKIQIHQGGALDPVPSSPGRAR